MRPRPTSRADKTPVRVVIVTLDTHLASAAEPLNALAVTGAVAVVAGSALCALGSRRAAPAAP